MVYLANSITCSRFLCPLVGDGLRHTNTLAPEKICQTCHVCVCCTMLRCVHSPYDWDRLLVTFPDLLTIPVGSNDVRMVGDIATSTLGNLGISPVPFYGGVASDCDSGTLAPVESRPRINNLYTGNLSVTFWTCDSPRYATCRNSFIYPHLARI